MIFIRIPVSNLYLKDLRLYSRMTRWLQWFSNFQSPEWLDITFPLSFSQLLRGTAARRRRRNGGGGGAGKGVHESPTIHRTQYIMYYVCKFEILIAILPKAVAVTSESLTHPSSFSLGFPPKVPTPYVPYARHYNPLLIRNRSWILTIHKARILRKKFLD